PAFPLMESTPVSRILRRVLGLLMTFSVMVRPASAAEPAFSTTAALLASSTTALWIRPPSVLSSFSALASSTPERSPIRFAPFPRPRRLRIAPRRPIFFHLRFRRLRTLHLPLAAYI